MKFFKKKPDPEMEMTQEQLRIVEGYIRYRISQTTPEEHLWGEQKKRLRADLDRYFSDLMQCLDESGQAILKEYKKCYEELMQLEKTDSFLEGRGVCALTIELQQRMKRRHRK